MHDVIIENGGGENIRYSRYPAIGNCGLRSSCEQGFSQDPGHRSADAIWCTCDVLPQLTAISQLGDSIRVLKGPCSVGCVSSGSPRHQFAHCVFCLG